MMWDTLTYFGAVIPGILAVCTLAYQIFQDATAKREETAAIKTAAKMKIISDMVANRYVLTDDGLDRTDSLVALREFNSALSRIPIDLIDNEEVLRQYKEFGYGFTGEKFHSIIIAMLKDAGTSIPREFDVSLLATVPTRNSANRA